LETIVIDDEIRMIFDIRSLFGKAFLIYRSIFLIIFVIIDFLSTNDICHQSISVILKSGSYQSFSEIAERNFLELQIEMG
jgi:hypothetical protein